MCYDLLCYAVTPESENFIRVSIGRLSLKIQLKQLTDSVDEPRCITYTANKMAPLQLATRRHGCRTGEQSNQYSIVYARDFTWIKFRFPNYRCKYF